ncbi:transposase [Streptomyces sp. NPDC056210]|uniref:IS701 family transposase n=1 Tax=Streptomyces sp. NPDC056210 TaxID=3345746 RepID=UPI0035E08155
MELIWSILGFHAVRDGCEMSRPSPVPPKDIVVQTSPTTSHNRKGCARTPHSVPSARAHDSWNSAPPRARWYGISTSFRLSLDERGLGYVLALTGNEVAHPDEAEPHRPAYAGLGPPTLPRYRTPPRALTHHAAGITTDKLAEVTWRTGSKGRMTSRYAVLTVRPTGKQARAAAQAAGGGHYQWDGVLPACAVLVEWPAGQDAPTGYWISNLPATTPVEDLVRWAKMRWRIEHDYRELKHGLGLDDFEGRTWRGWNHHVTLVTAAQAFITLRRLDLKAHTPV